MDIEIRDEAWGDDTVIHAVNAAAFGREAEARLVDLIRERGETLISLVAVRGEAIVGHVLISPMTVDALPNVAFGAVGPLAVEPSLQQGGIGGMLMRSVIDRSREKGLRALFLLGSPRYYPRFGFVQSHLDNEYGAGAEFMHLELTAGVLDSVGGMARYVSAFAEVESY